MAFSSRIAELASTIQKHTAIIDESLSVQCSQPLSFAIDAPAVIPLSREASASRDVLLDSAEELQALVAGPLPALIRMTSPTVNVLMSLQAIYRFKIATSFALDEEISFKNLGQRCGLSESDTSRFLRLAIANRIFEEPRKGTVAHNALSKLLAQLPQLHQWIGLVCDEMWPSGTRAIDALMKWPNSEEPQHTGFSLVEGNECLFFDRIGSQPQRAQRFADAMHFMQSATQFDLSFLVDNIPWKNGTCPELMVDIGGSHGSVCIQLLRCYPSLRCIVQDLPQIVAGAEIPPDLHSRLSFQAHDFFSEQQVKGADVYFFRSIIHDWHDKYAIKILRNLIPALKGGARVIFNEICLPEPGILSCYQEQFLRGYDLAMKQNLNAKERDADEWAKLLGDADSRFKMVDIKSPPGSILSIIEVTWESESSMETSPTRSVE